MLGKRRGYDLFENPSKTRQAWLSKADKRPFLNKSNLGKRYNHYNTSGQKMSVWGRENG